MAGIEQLEVHSKSYIVRWVKVDEGHTISWSVQPHKKSINFGIVKHPGSGATNITSDVTNQLDQVDGAGSNVKSGRFSRKDASTAQEQLGNKGFIPIKWHGKCDADKVSIGTYDVQAGQGGMFGLIFDNTFSKQISKTATFVLLTYPTGAPPQTAHYLPNLQSVSHSNTSKTSLGKQSSPGLGATASDSVDSLHSPHAGRTLSIAGRSDGGSTPAAYHTGLLLKRRRKKGQGYARRFFSLDYSSCTLSYYYNRSSSALRGAIPLSLAAIAADERRREISIDSGAEIWHLRASNAKDFTEWARALERASRIARGLETSPTETAAHGRLQLQTSGPSMRPNNPVEAERDWQQVETLVSRVVGTRDALRRLVRDMARPQPAQRPASSYLSPGGTHVVEDDSYFSPLAQEKRPFWRRKSSTSPLAPQNFQPAVSSSLAVPAAGTITTISADNSKSRRKSIKFDQEGGSLQDHCQAILNDLDTVVMEFTGLIANSKRRRIPIPVSAGSRLSLDSTASTDEFYDAEAGDPSSSQVMMVDHSENESPESDADEASLHTASSVSSVEDDETFPDEHTNSLYPSKPKSFAPLPVDIAIDRRTTIPPATVLPPSLIAFVRKNVGKDLSTISMPVSANEPISLLQRVAEQLEYAKLLDEASQLKDPKQRLQYVAAFAISQLSNSRARERAIRKPFNPLLGETFELLRTESEVPGGFRLIVEKVTHRPVRLAMQADSANWSFTQSPAPTQKFWGKSAEINTEGRVRMALRLPDDSDELYSWTHATMFLRNVVMGEKYVEPVGSMTIINETNGAKATVEFKSKGMFGGRAEDIQVETYGPDGGHDGTLTGNWTQSLRIMDGGKSPGQTIWKVGDLVPNAATVYGMTAYAATLNEITDIEKGRLPPTDSRLRPDQRLAEHGKLDAAEAMKVKLEERQRRRRREMEEKGEDWKPKWFVKVATDGDGEEVWRLKTGKEGYWEERSKGEWKDTEPIFDADA